MGRGAQKQADQTAGRRQYTKADFEQDVRGLSNRELVNRGATAILEAAVMASFPRFDDGKADAIAGAVYDEANRRGNPDLYERAFNQVAISQGHSGMTGEISTPIEYRTDQ